MGYDADGRLATEARNWFNNQAGALFDNGVPSDGEIASAMVDNAISAILPPTSFDEDFRRPMAYQLNAYDPNGSAPQWATLNTLAVTAFLALPEGGTAVPESEMTPAADTEVGAEPTIIPLNSGSATTPITTTTDAAEAAPTAEQLANLARFEKKLPANATPTKVFDLPNGGKAFQADSASKNIPSSFAQYEKQVDAAGNTLQYTKTTFGPNGEIIHVKDKIGGGTFP
jgi:hypothetical protein